MFDDSRKSKQKQRELPHRSFEKTTAEVSCIHLSNASSSFMKSARCVLFH